MALAMLGIPFLHIFGSEVNKRAREQLQATFEPSFFFHDLRRRQVGDVPRVDLYIAGFPCQPFSQAGSGTGFKDRVGGDLFFHIVHYIREREPLIFILENVEGIDRVSGGRCFEIILQTLWSLTNYNLYWRLLNTSEHGVPQNRPRYYFVGIWRASDRGTFAFPPMSPPSTLESFLDARQGRPSWADLPPPSQSVARANLIRVLRRLDASGCDPFLEPWVSDIDSSAGWEKALYNASPCLTRSRWQGHWLTNRGRRMSTSEMMRLQGFPVTLTQAIPDKPFRECLGNSMSLNILKPIISSALGAIAWCYLADAWVWNQVPSHPRF